MRGRDITTLSDGAQEQTFYSQISEQMSGPEIS